MKAMARTMTAAAAMPASAFVTGAMALLTLACEPLHLDPFLYDPLPAPAGGYQLSTAVIPGHDDLFFATPDGEKLHVAYVPPKSSAPAGAPALVYFHGQSNNVGSSWERAENLYPLGWALYMVDLRGYGLSTGTPTEEGLMTDLAALAKFLTEQRGIAPGQLVIYGHSLGGAFAIHLATIVKPRALVIESTFTSIAALVADGAYAPLPVSFAATSRWDNLAKIKTITSPLLLFHGTDDQYVMFRYGQELIAAHPGRHQFVPVEGANHSSVPATLGLQRYRDIIAAFAGGG
jgi:pimeloyl-ACP methyl ester carboxylesterase